jgi:hypothetical protein
VDDDPSDLTLADVLGAAAEGIDGVTRATDDGATTWSVGSVPFVELNGSTASFRLDPLVAHAALRTPDTEPSIRGAEWVAFAPSVVDDLAVDRAEAWFLSAARRAASNRSRNH